MAIIALLFLFLEFLDWHCGAHYLRRTVSSMSRYRPEANIGAFHRFSTGPNILKVLIDSGFPTLPVKSTIHHTSFHAAEVGPWRLIGV